MNRSNLWIILILLLALGSGIAYFITAQEKVEQERGATLSKFNREKLSKLEEANQMLEQQIAENKQKTNERVKKLNQLLIRELTAREEAEKSTAELIAKAEELKDALAKQEAAMKLLAAEKQELAAVESEPEMDTQVVVKEIVDPKTEQELLASQDLVKKQQVLLQEMQAEKERLEKERLAAIERQIELEQEILTEGGEVEIENYEVRAPNYRRRHKLFMDNRAISRVTR